MQTLNDKIEIIQQAAQRGQPIGFTYLHQNSDPRSMAPDFSERRQLIPDPDEPVRTNKSGEQYVIGDDLARGECRSFTLSKITEVAVG